MTVQDDMEEYDSELSEFEDLQISKNDNDQEGDMEVALTAVTDLLTRCKLLLQEVGFFLEALVKRKRSTVEFRHFKTSVQNEIKFLEKVCIS